MKNLIKTKRIRARVSWPSRKPEAKPAEEDGCAYCCCASGRKRERKSDVVLYEKPPATYSERPAVLLET